MLEKPFLITFAMAGLAVLHQTTRSSSAAGGAAVDQTQDNTSSEVIAEEAGSVMLKAWRSLRIFIF